MKLPPPAPISYTSQAHTEKKKKETRSLTRHGTAANHCRRPGEPMATPRVVAPSAAPTRAPHHPRARFFLFAPPPLQTQLRPSFSSRRIRKASGTHGASKRLPAADRVHHSNQTPRSGGKVARQRHALDADLFMLSRQSQPASQAALLRSSPRAQASGDRADQ